MLTKSSSSAEMPPLTTRSTVPVTAIAVPAPLRLVIRSFRSRTAKSRVITGPDDWITEAMDDVLCWSPTFWAMFGIVTYRTPSASRDFHSRLTVSAVLLIGYLINTTTAMSAEARANLTNPSMTGEKSFSPSWMSGNARPHSATAESAETGLIQLPSRKTISLWAMPN